MVEINLPGHHNSLATNFRQVHQFYCPLAANYIRCISFIAQNWCRISLLGKIQFSEFLKKYLTRFSSSIMMGRKCTHQRLYSRRKNLQVTIISILIFIIIAQNSASSTTSFLLRKIINNESFTTHYSQSKSQMIAKAGGKINLFLLVVNIWLNLKYERAERVVSEIPLYSYWERGRCK